MATRIIQHVRSHVIAYLALACGLLALGGAAYAAVQIPPGSVGERQIKNRVIDPVKWDPAFTTGFVRHWAVISSTGSIISTSPGGGSTSTGTGNDVVTWGDAFAGWCAPVATVLGGSVSRPSPPSTGAYADARIVPRSGQSTLVAVATYNFRGRPTGEQVSVSVVCGPGAGGPQTFPANLP
jgi:hypothetical protein